MLSIWKILVIIFFGFLKNNECVKSRGFSSFFLLYQERKSKEKDYVRKEIKRKKKKRRLETRKKLLSCGDKKQYSSSLCFLFDL